MRRHPCRPWQSVLLLPLFVYLLLPFFGSVWHDVVPEHDHLFLDQSNSQDIAASHAPGEDSQSACLACTMLIPYRTVVHAFNPASALQVFGIALGLCASLTLMLPLGPWTRVLWPTLFPRAARLAPLDPPPTTTWFPAQVSLHTKLQPVI